MEELTSVSGVINLQLVQMHGCYSLTGAYNIAIGNNALGAVTTGNIIILSLVLILVVVGW